MKNLNTLGKITSFEKFFSRTVYKIATKYGTFDYTVFGEVNPSLDIGVSLEVALGFSAKLGAYTVKYITNITKAA